MLDAIHLKQMGFDLFINAELNRVQSQGAKITLGNMTKGKFVPSENGVDWTVIKAKYPDESFSRIRTIEQFWGDFKNESNL
jgi:hypothetical protein